MGPTTRMFNFPGNTLNRELKRRTLSLRAKSLFFEWACHATSLSSPCISLHFHRRRNKTLTSHLVAKAFLRRRPLAWSWVSSRPSRLYAPIQAVSGKPLWIPIDMGTYKSMSCRQFDMPTKHRPTSTTIFPICIDRSRTNFISQFETSAKPFDWGW